MKYKVAHDVCFCCWCWEQNVVRARREHDVCKNEFVWRVLGKHYSKESTLLDLQTTPN